MDTVADPDAAAGDAQPEAAPADDGSDEEDRNEDEGDGAGKTEAAAADAAQMEDAVMEEEAEGEREEMQQAAVEDREDIVPAAEVSRACSPDRVSPAFDPTRVVAASSGVMAPSLLASCAVDGMWHRMTPIC